MASKKITDAVKYQVLLWIAEHKYKKEFKELTKEFLKWEKKRLKQE